MLDPVLQRKALECNFVQNYSGSLHCFEGAPCSATFLGGSEGEVMAELVLNRDFQVHPAYFNVLFRMPRFPDAGFYLKMPLKSCLLLWPQRVC